VRRFQRMHGPPGLEFAAYIPFYAACNIKFRGDGDVSDRPIRIHHGLADDFIPIAPCRLYVARLRAANKDVVLTAYPNAYHFFDNPGIPQPRQAVRWQTTRSCAMHEDQNGRVINNASGRMFSYEDACVELGPTQGYNAEAHAASVRAVKAFLSSTFGL
jgi:dienelactone hydrolase